MLLNSLLRFTWALQLSSHLHINFHSPFVLFFLEWLEVARRWLWIFLRAEKEWIVTGNHQTDLENEVYLEEFQNNSDASSSTLSDS
jgi:hypothetical protein